MSSQSFEAPSLETLAQLLPAYEFEAFIAQGGMGAVYKARQRSLDRDVAIKILPRGLGEDPEFRQSFETEARAMARLNHPNLIGVYDSGDVDGMLYIVMEYVNGKSLYHSSYNMAVEPRQAVTIVKAICEGLEHAHENGVIHRDIKPANILLTPKAEPKIGDFGLARPAGSDGPGLIMGTPGYTAPEILRHPEHADRRSDLYAVGVILFELLTGQRAPEEGLVPTPSTYCGCDPTLDKICQQATHPNPAFRYPSARAMVDALDDWLRRAPSVVASRPLATSAPKAAPRAMASAVGKMPPRTVSSRPAVAQEAGGNATFARNLVIIAGLIVVIALTWKHYQKVKADREEQSRIVQEKNEERSREAKAAAERAAREAKERETALQEELVKKARYENETPLESLARLKESLVAGNREQMPKGTVRHGEFHYFAVPVAMSWHEAAAFAEDHGGHLATVTSDEDLLRLSNLVPKPEGDAEAGIWIGAGRAGRDQWMSVDGSPWSLSSAPTGVGHFVVLTDLGIVRARRTGDRFPFLIQWHHDGSNPGTLAAMLQRTRESLSSTVPVFPPGTLAYQTRHVLILPHAATATEAVEFAEHAGGHLAVPASRDEAGWLADRMAEIEGEGYWIGASREGDRWKWITGERWDFAQWAEGQPSPDGTFAMFVPGKGWAAADPEDKMTGFVIEWSTDRNSVTGDGSADLEGEAGEDVAALEAKVKELIAALDKDRQKELATNARTFTWDLDVWIRDLKKSDHARWKPEVTQLKALVQDNRVPATVEGSGIRLSEKMAEVVARTATKQASIDAEFKTKATRIRDAYVVRLREAKATADKSGQAALANALAVRIEAASDLDGWLEKRGFGTATEDGADPLVGGWKFHNGTYQFLADGKASTYSDSGVWKFEGETEGKRNYLVEWESGAWDKFTLSESDEGPRLEGVNNDGKRIEASRDEE